MKSIYWGNFEGEHIAKAQCTRVPIRLFFLVLGLNESKRLYWPEKEGFQQTEVKNFVLLFSTSTSKKVNLPLTSF